MDVLALTTSDRNNLSKLTNPKMVFNYGNLNFYRSEQKAWLRSRSTLYKLKRDGLLDDYLVEVNGRDQLLLKPVGKPKLKDYLGSILQWHANRVINNHF